MLCQTKSCLQTSSGHGCPDHPIYGKCPKISYTKVSNKISKANSTEPDQTTPEGAVWSESTLFAIPQGILTFTTLLAFQHTTNWYSSKLLFSRKQVLTFHANCLHWRQFAWNLKTCFLRRKIRKIFLYVGLCRKFYPECQVLRNNCRKGKIYGR